MIFSCSFYSSFDPCSWVETKDEGDCTLTILVWGTYDISVYFNYFLGYINSLKGSSPFSEAIYD